MNISPAKKVLLLTVLSMGIFAAPSIHSISAQSAVDYQARDLSLQESVGYKDLGVGEPLILSSGRFYFIKRWWRGLRRLLSFGVVSDAKLEIKFSNQVMAEIKKLADQGKAVYVPKAIQEYEEINNRLDKKIRDVSKSDRDFLEKFGQRFIVQQKLIPQLIYELLEISTSSVEQLLKIENDLSAQFEAQAGKNSYLLEYIVAQLRSESKTPLSPLRSLEVADILLSKSTQPSFVDSLINLRNKLFFALYKNIIASSEKEFEKSKILFDALVMLSGDKLRHREIVLELGFFLQDSRLKNLLNRSEDNLFSQLAEKKQLLSRNADISINFAKSAISILTEGMQERSKIPDEVIKLLKQAQQEFGSAVKEFEKNNYLEAILKAQEAESLAYSADRLLKGIDVNIKADNNLKDIDFVPEVNGSESKKESPSTTTPTTTRDSQKLCIQIYDPVCGDDGNTYSNSCFAEAAGVEISYKGECKTGKTDGNPEIQPIARLNLSAAYSCKPRKVDLVWTISSDNQPDKVLRCSPGGCTPIPPKDHIGTSLTRSYTDFEVKEDTSYSYRVVINRSGIDTYSNIVKVLVSCGVTD